MSNFLIPFKVKDSYFQVKSSETESDETNRGKTQADERGISVNSSNRKCISLTLATQRGVFGDFLQILLYSHLLLVQGNSTIASTSFPGKTFQACYSLRKQTKLNNSFLSNTGVE